MSASIAEIQDELRALGLGGWLFIDFRKSDPLAYSILQLPADVFLSRRWCYFIPAEGTPTRIVHAIEPGALDSLTGTKVVYLAWKELHEALAHTLSTSGSVGATGPLPVAMQYSPNNAIPYVGRVDAGTVELIRSFGVNVVTSADLVQRFEATLSSSQYSSHVFAADIIARICEEGFDEIGRRLTNGSPPTEFEIQQFLVQRMTAEGLITDHPPIVAAGVHAADPHFAPSSSIPTTIGREETVLIDLWAKRREPGSIYADITRVAYTGQRIPGRYQEVFEIVRDARDAAIRFVQDAWERRQSITGAEVDDACREVIKKAGLAEYFIHRTGHSIHQSTHGNGANIDNLETQDGRRLIPNTLFSIEPGVYIPGVLGIRSEINVFLSTDSAIVTGPARQREIYRIG